MNHWMEIQAPSVTSLSFPGLAGPESTFGRRNIMGWSPTNPRKCPVRCVFGAERGRLVNKESSDGPNAQIYTAQTTLVAFPPHLLYSAEGKRL